MDGRRGRPVARAALNRRGTGKARKAGGATGKTAPRRWLIPVALIVFAACAYLFYYLDSLPQAETIGREQKGSAHSGDQLRLHGMTRGEALHLDIRQAARIRVSFGLGATLLPDPARGPAQPSGASGLLVRLVNIEPEVSWISIRLSPDRTGERSTLILEPSSPDRSYLTLRLRSEDTSMTIDMGTIPRPGEGEHSRILVNGAAIATASLLVPAGTPVTLGIRTGNLGALDLRAGDVTGAEIGSAADGDFERQWMVCGSARRRILWQRPIPRVETADCEAGRLSIAQLNIADGIEVVAEGTGFTARDGVTTVWQGFRTFRLNAVVQALLSALLVGLAGWVILVVRRRFAA